jgi:hypothetical protein
MDKSDPRRRPFFWSGGEHGSAHQPARQQPRIAIGDYTIAVHVAHDKLDTRCPAHFVEDQLVPVDVCSLVNLDI